MLLRSNILKKQQQLRDLPKNFYKKKGPLVITEEEQELYAFNHKGRVGINPTQSYLVGLQSSQERVTSPK